MAEKSYTSAVSQAPLLGDTIGENFDRAVRSFGDQVALVDVPAGHRLTYAELAAEVDTLALGLLAAGISKGDRVGIWAPNCVEWVYTSMLPRRSVRSWSTSIPRTGPASSSSC